MNYRHFVPEEKRALQRKNWLYSLGAILAIALYSTQFYLFNSGTLQISHMALLLFCGVCLLKYRADKPLFKGKTLLLFTAFIGYSTFVNLFYYLLRPEHEVYLVRSSLYLWFDYLIFISLITFNRLIPVSLFRKIYTIPFLVGLASIVLFYISGLGRYSYPPRYNAFFNDPNQMAFWTLCTLAVVIITESNKWIKRVMLLLAVFVCVVSMSRSGFSGLIFVLIGYFWNGFRALFAKKNRWKTLTAILFIVVVLAYTIKQYTNIMTTGGLNLFQRLIQTNVVNELTVRGYGILVHNPEYLFIGYGGGDMMRLGHPVEIHSTWGGILFYYGVIGLGLFVGFVYKLLRPLPIPALLVALGPMVYSFFTYGARTPIFYIFLAILFSYNQYIKPKQYDKLSDIQCSNSPVQ